MCRRSSNEIVLLGKSDEDLCEKKANEKMKTIALKALVKPMLKLLKRRKKVQAKNVQIEKE